MVRRARLAGRRHRWCGSVVARQASAAKDIDVVVMDAYAEALVRSGAEFGFTPRIADAIEFARNTRVLLLRYLPAAIDLDLSLGMLPFEQEVVERAIVSAGRIWNLNLT